MTMVRWNSSVFVVFIVLCVTVCSGEMKCYQCNSNSQTETDCVSSDADKLKSFIKSCVSPKEGAHSGAPAVGCRKILQEVNDEEWTIRECAFSGEDVNGAKRTGNKGIRLFYYQCTNADGTDAPCNAVAGLFSSSQQLWCALVAVVVLLLVS